MHNISEKTFAITYFAIKKMRMNLSQFLLFFVFFLKNGMRKNAKQNFAKKFWRNDFPIWLENPNEPKS